MGCIYRLLPVTIMDCGDEFYAWLWEFEFVESTLPDGGLPGFGYSAHNGEAVHPVNINYRHFQIDYKWLKQEFIDGLIHRNEGSIRVWLIPGYVYLP